MHYMHHSHYMPIICPVDAQFTTPTCIICIICIIRIICSTPTSLNCLHLYVCIHHYMLYSHHWFIAFSTRSMISNTGSNIEESVASSDGWNGWNVPVSSGIGGTMLGGLDMAVAAVWDVLLPTLYGLNDRSCTTERWHASKTRKSFELMPWISLAVTMYLFSRFLWGRRGNDHCSGYMYYVVPPLSRHVMKIIIIIIFSTNVINMSNHMYGSAPEVFWTWGTAVKVICLLSPCN